MLKKISLRKEQERDFWPQYLPGTIAVSFPVAAGNDKRI
jgi:hypothetical protein